MEPVRRPVGRGPKVRAAVHAATLAELLVTADPVDEDTADHAVAVTLAAARAGALS